MSKPTTYVFVYGSLLNPRELRCVGIDPEKCVPANLRGYVIAFNKRSEKRCAAANLEKQEGGEVMDVVCEVSEDVLRRLEERERNYSKEIVEVTTIENRRVKAVAFICRDPEHILSDNEIKQCLSNVLSNIYYKVL